MLLIALSGGIVLGVAFHLVRPGTPSPAPESDTTQSTQSSPSSLAAADPGRPDAGETPARSEAEETHAEAAAQGQAVRTATAAGAATVARAPGSKADNLVFQQAVETLASAQSGYDERRSAWKKLKKSGKLDEAISELEQRAANDPRSAQNASALGQAYYKKAGQTDDIREQAILAMKADRALEAALNIEPNDWEARFTKASGMSYWPTQLNKGPEVIQQFQKLIQQQETQAAQPQFAETYLLLGNYYQNLGRVEEAAQTWQRGAALYPGNEDLTAKMASGVAQK